MLAYTIKAIYAQLQNTYFMIYILNSYDLYLKQWSTIIKYNINTFHKLMYIDVAFLYISL